MEVGDRVTIKGNMLFINPAISDKFLKKIEIQNLSDKNMAIQKKANNVRE